MRVFQNLNEAALEIKRDLAKSPLVHSSRVQQFEVESEAHEALCYDYTILKFPESEDELIQEGVQRGFWEEEEVPAISRWLHIETRARLNWEPGEVTETAHPDLAKVLEGSEPAYTYTDRMHGALDALERLFIKSPDTRRGFWPIFHPDDAIRAQRDTRIPCSLGYQVLIRDVNGEQYLHLVYLERSCDFDRFWLTDLWLAREFQKELHRRLRRWGQTTQLPLGQLKLGHLSHVVVSLHSFINEEIY